VVERPAGPNGLKAELFADAHLLRCVKVRYDPQVKFDWGIGSPDPLLPADFFSIRWTGWLKAPRPGRYTLQLESDDGVRLWLDGKLLIDGWTPGDRLRYTAEVELRDLPRAIRLEYFELTQAAAVSLSWAQAGGFAMRPVASTFLFHDRAVAEKVVIPGRPGSRPSRHAP
jgi:hypothetical protein